MKSSTLSCSARNERSISQSPKFTSANIPLLSEFFSVFRLFPNEDLTIDLNIKLNSELFLVSLKLICTTAEWTFGFG